LWYFFLHGVALIGEQGSAFTYQLIIQTDNERSIASASLHNGGHMR